MTRLVVLYLCLIGTFSVAILVKENVIFNKIAEVSLSITSWRLTIVVDLNGYIDVFDMFLVDLQRIEVILTDTIETHRKNNVNMFQGYYSDLRRELAHIYDTRKNVIRKFETCRSLHNEGNAGKDRKKRAFSTF